MKNTLFALVTLGTVSSPLMLVPESPRQVCLEAARSAYQVKHVSCSTTDAEGTRKACLRKIRHEYREKKLACPARSSEQTALR